MRKIAVSVGDLNGVGIEIALRSHSTISLMCDIVYCIDKQMLYQASSLLNIEIPSSFTLSDLISEQFSIEPSSIDAKSGRYSYDSFYNAVELAESKMVDAIVTLPIHKESWAKAGLKFVGHTDFLRQYFRQDAIMMLGCEKLFVALYTEHVPLKDVASKIKKEPLSKFLITLHSCIKAERIALLALNPHAGDGGVLGSEEIEIAAAAKIANAHIGADIFTEPLVPDTAFTPAAIAKHSYMVAMYHDQGLAPLKALYFDQSINISLNLPIVRTSVDHGTAFDIAYKNRASTTSYINAIKAAVKLS